MRKAAIALSFLVASVTSAACGKDPIILRPTNATITAEDYEDILDRHTRSTEVYEDFESRVFFHATYWSHSFTDAYLAQYAAFFKPPPEKLTAYRRKVEERTTEAHELFVALFTNEHTWNDLDREDSDWRLWLDSDRGAKVAPLSVERVRERDDVARAFFPYLTHFRVGYRVRFPATDANGKPTIPRAASNLSLLLTGPRGEATLTWEIAR